MMDKEYEECKRTFAEEKLQRKRRLHSAICSTFVIFAVLYRILP
jgi:hypothetical protein